MRNIFYSLCMLAVMLSFTSFHPAEIPYGDNPAVGKYIMLNGVKHYYEVYGEGQPMLLIHGNRTGIKGWNNQIEYFSKHYKVYAVDCRGRGKSDIGPDSLSYRQTAEDMNAFLVQMNLDSVNVIGRSDGGIIALLMGIKYPQRLHKIVSWSANLTPDTMALYPETARQAAVERRIADKMLAANDKSRNWYVEQQRNRMMEYQPDISASELRRIPVPVLVMTGDRDVIKVEHTMFIAQNIRYSNLCIMPGEVHRMPGLNPALFNSMVHTYLNKPFMPHKTRFE